MAGWRRTKLSKGSFYVSFVVPGDPLATEIRFAVRQEGHLWRWPEAGLDWGRAGPVLEEGAAGGNRASIAGGGRSSGSGGSGGGLEPPEPRVGSRVRVRFDNNEYYKGRYARF